MEGDLSLLSIPDLLQMICLGGYSRDIHLFDGPTQLGVIAIRNGQVDRCFGFGMWGEAAFFKLVSLRRGRYKVNEAQDMTGSDASLTAYSWQELLMEAARIQDEAQHAVQSAAASAGRIIPFPTAAVTSTGGASGAGGATMLRDSSPDLDFSGLDAGPSSQPMGFVSTAPSRRSSDTGRLTPVPAAPPSALVSAPAPTVPASPVASPAPVASAAPPEIAVPAAPAEIAPSAAPVDSAPSELSASERAAQDVTNLLEEATACYLRRDLARAEALLQKCLELRPGDKRALQNLERIRRKKSP